MSLGFSSTAWPWLRLSSHHYYISFLCRAEQKGETNCRGRWWSDSAPHKAASRPLSWPRWWVWSAAGAGTDGSPCPVRWPSSGSGCRRCCTHGRADGCDLQGEQWSQVWAQAAPAQVTMAVEDIQVNESLISDSEWELFSWGYALALFHNV